MHVIRDSHLFRSVTRDGFFNTDRPKFGSFFVSQHDAMMVGRESQDRSMTRAMALEGAQEDEDTFQRLTLKESSQRATLKERNPWVTRH